MQYHDVSFKIDNPKHKHTILIPRMYGSTPHPEHLKSN